jgi:hypothetical protein
MLQHVLIKHHLKRVHDLNSEVLLKLRVIRLIEGSRKPTKNLLDLPRPFPHRSVLDKSRVLENLLLNFFEVRSSGTLEGVMTTVDSTRGLIPGVMLPLPV